MTILFKKTLTALSAALLITSALTLGGAGSAQASGCTNTVINNTTVCVPNSDGGVAGGGSASTGGDGQGTITCGPGYVIVVAGNGAKVCSPTGTGGVAGGGSASTGGDGQGTITCGPGYVIVVAGNGAKVCSPTGIGNAGSGSGGSTEGDGKGSPSGGSVGGVNSPGGLPKLPPVVLPPGASGKTVDRLAGVDRYTTAAAVSRSGYPGTAKVVYLATGTNYPDALAAAPAAAKEGGPLLLTQPGVLSAATASEIKRLKPTKVVIVGGTGAVSNNVMTAVKRIVPNTVRRAGADRYATARAVVTGAFSASATAYIATGADYPDALSASASAGAAGAPVVLVNGSTKSLDAATTSLLNSLRVKKTVIAGGTGVVSAGVEKSLKAFSPIRQSGADRFTTSQKLNADLAKGASRVYLATGYGYPDALAGSAIAGAKKAPLYVVKPNCIPASILNSINTSKASRVTLLGGTGVLNDGVSKLAVCK